MRVQYNMTHLLALNVLLLPKDLIIIYFRSNFNKKKWLCQSSKMRPRLATAEIRSYLVGISTFIENLVDGCHGNHAVLHSAVNI